MRMTLVGQTVPEAVVDLHIVTRSTRMAIFWVQLAWPDIMYRHMNRKRYIDPPFVSVYDQVPVVDDRPRRRDHSSRGVSYLGKAYHVGTRFRSPGVQPTRSFRVIKPSLSEQKVTNSVTVQSIDPAWRPTATRQMARMEQIFPMALPRVQNCCGVILPRVPLQCSGSWIV